MNNAYARKMVSDELRETLMFAGLVDDYHCKTKVLGSDGKTRHYELKTHFGTCKVVSPKNIYVNDKKFTSLYLARKEIYKFL
jgi:hypothetical protein